MVNMPDKDAFIGVSDLVAVEAPAGEKALEGHLRKLYVNLAIKTTAGTDSTETSWTRTRIE
jgi:hypothetical protein